MITLLATEQDELPSTQENNGRAPRSRSVSVTCPQKRLKPGNPAAPEGSNLPLLPSGPGGVRRSSPRGTRLSTPPAADRGHVHQSLIRGVQPRYSGLRVQGAANSPPSTTTSIVLLVTPHGHVMERHMLAKDENLYPLVST